MLGQMETLFDFFRNCQTAQLHYFTSLPTVYDGSNFSASNTYSLFLFNIFIGV